MLQNYEESPIFTIRELNTPWREVLHMGIRQVCSKSYTWTDTEQHDSFAFLHKGRVRLINPVESGEERILLDVGQGCLFREVEAFHISRWYPATFVALEKCEVYHFPIHLLNDEVFAREHPALMINLVRSLGVKTGAFFSQVSEASHLSPRLKVCRFIKRLADRHPGENRFAPDISQSEMAEALGLHRSTVCRIIHDLRSEGLIGAFSRRNMEVLKPDSLV